MAKEKDEEGAKFVRYFGPLLDALRALGGSAKADEAVDRVAEDLKLQDNVLNEVLPSGGSRFRNQVAWARFYLVREGLLDSSKPIELIDGEKLLDMLEKLELGLKPVTTYEVEHAFFKEFEA